MYCENCGKQIEDGSRFCRYCGGKIDSAEIPAAAAGRAESAVIVNETAAAAVTGMAETGTKDKQKKSKRGLIATITAVLVAALAVLIGFSIYNKPENRLARALALGQRYLLEENYEQAIVEFNRAIEIDPKNEEAYIGLAEAYAETDDLKKAVRILEKGAGKTDSEELQELLERYAGKLAQVGELDIVADSEVQKASVQEANKMLIPAAEEPELLPEDIEAAVPAQETDDMAALAAKEAAMEIEEPAAKEETIKSESTRQEQSARLREELPAFDGYYIDIYDGNGNIIKIEAHLYPDGRLGWLYTYDKNGNCIKDEWYNADGSLRSYMLYIYDGNGNRIKEECYNADGSLQYEFNL